MSMREPPDHGHSLFLGVHPAFRPPHPPAIHLPAVADVPNFGDAPHESDRTFPDVHHLPPRPGQNLPARYTGPLVN